MSFDVFKTCINKIPKEEAISFSGFCEPWLNPDCTKMVKWAFDKGHRIYVSTSLVGMTIRDIELLETLNLYSLVVHLPSNDGSDKIKVDEKYSEVLYKIFTSPINNIVYHIRGIDTYPQIRSIVGDRMLVGANCNRAGNMKLKNAPRINRKIGTIGCKCNLQSHVLLPNGDVVLCCMDIGLKHVIGNLLHQDYPSLYHSEEFIKVKRGQGDDSKDILCRYCEDAQNINICAKIFNPLNYYISNLWQHKWLNDIYNLKFIHKCVYYLKKVHNLQDLKQFINQIIIYFKRI